MKRNTYGILKRNNYWFLKRTVYGLWAAAAIALWPMAADAAQYKSIKVTNHDGSSILIKGEKGITMTVTDDEMNFFTDPAFPLTLPTVDVKGITLSGEEGTVQLAAIDAIAAGDITLDRVGEELIIGNLPLGSHISIVSLGGTIFHDATAEGSYSISLSSYPKGVYVVTVNNKTFKISATR